MHVRYKLGVSEDSDGSSRESRDPGADAFLGFRCNRLSPLRPQEVARETGRTGWTSAR